MGSSAGWRGASAEIRRESHFHQNDRRLRRTEFFGERFRAGDHVGAAVGGERPIDDAFLQIDEEERGFLGIEDGHGGLPGERSSP